MADLNFDWTSANRSKWAGKSGFLSADKQSNQMTTTTIKKEKINKCGKGHFEEIELIGAHCKEVGSHRSQLVHSMTNDFWLMSLDVPLPPLFSTPRRPPITTVRIAAFTLSIMRASLIAPSSVEVFKNDCGKLRCVNID
jgi:hypothetical protein